MHEEDMPRRCGWFAIASMIFLLQGILPATFIGGMISRQAAHSLLSCAVGSEIALRLCVLAGMIAGPLVLAVSIVFPVLFAARSLRMLFRSSQRRSARTVEP
jgi:hypothetical protein